MLLQFFNLSFLNESASMAGTVFPRFAAGGLGDGGAFSFESGEIFLRNCSFCTLFLSMMFYWIQTAFSSIKKINPPRRPSIAPKEGPGDGRPGVLALAREAYEPLSSLPPPPSPSESEGAALHPRASDRGCRAMEGASDATPGVSLPSDLHRRSCQKRCIPLDGPPSPSEGLAMEGRGRPSSPSDALHQKTGARSSPPLPTKLAEIEGEASEGRWKDSEMEPQGQVLQQKNHSKNRLSFPYKLPSKAGYTQSVETNFGTITMVLSNLLLMCLLIFRWKESGHFPLSNLYESLMFLSWSCTFIHLILERVFWVKTPPSIARGYNAPLSFGSEALLVHPSASIAGRIRSASSGDGGAGVQSEALLILPVRRAAYEPLLSVSERNKVRLDANLFSKLIGSITSPSALFTNAFATFSLPVEMQKASPLVPALQSNWLMMHVTVMIISYSALILGSLLSIAFLILVSVKSSSDGSNTPKESRSFSPWAGPSLRLPSIIGTPSFAWGSLSLRTPWGSPAIAGGVRSDGTPLRKLPLPSIVGGSNATPSMAPKERGSNATPSMAPKERGGHGAPGASDASPSMAGGSHRALLTRPSIAGALLRSDGGPGMQGERGGGHSDGAPGERRGKGGGTIRSDGDPSDLAWNFDNLSYRVLGIGFPFLTIGILSGAVWANEAWGSYWSWDPKETWALLTWLIFAIYLHARITKGWQGKKPAMIASLGFLAIWVCFLGVNLIGEGLHSYGWFSLS